MLWGARAARYSDYITNRTHSFIITSHPSPLSNTKRLGDFPAFTGSKCFSKFNRYIHEKYNKEIIW
jgi:uracil DNA glycosylase